MKTLIKIFSFSFLCLICVPCKGFALTEVEKQMLNEMLNDVMQVQCKDYPKINQKELQKNIDEVEKLLAKGFEKNPEIQKLIIIEKAIYGGSLSKNQRDFARKAADILFDKIHLESLNLVRDSGLLEITTPSRFELRLGKSMRSIGDKLFDRPDSLYVFFRLPLPTDNNPSATARVYATYDLTSGTFNNNSIQVSDLISTIENVAKEISDKCHMDIGSFLEYPAPSVNTQIVEAKKYPAQTFIPVDKHTPEVVLAD